MTVERNGERFLTRKITSTEASLDELARGLASGTVSRRQVLRLACAAVVSAALVPLLPGMAEALTSRQRRRCRRQGGTVCGSGRREYCCRSGTVCGPNKTCPRACENDPLVGTPCSIQGQEVECSTGTLTCTDAGLVCTPPPGC